MNELISIEVIFIFLFISNRWLPNITKNVRYSYFLHIIWSVLRLVFERYSANWTDIVFDIEAFFVHSYMLRIYHGNFTNKRNNKSTFLESKMEINVQETRKTHKWLFNIRPRYTYPKDTCLLRFFIRHVFFVSSSLPSQSNSLGILPLT